MSGDTPLPAKKDTPYLNIISAVTVIFCYIHHSPVLKLFFVHTECKGSLFDFVPDKGENVEDLATKDIYTLQLRNTLDCAMKDLPRRQEMILRARYYEDLQQEAIARRLNCTSSNVSQQEQAALDALYQARFQNGLHEYLEQNTNYSRHVGVRRFRSTGTSAVEEIVFQRERLIGKWMKAHYRKSIGGEADADDTEGAAAPVYEENRVV